MLRNRLRELFGKGVRFARPQSDSESQFDLVVQTPTHRFVCELKPSGELATVKTAVDQLKHYGGSAVPLVVVPYMGRAGREGCREAGVAWLDLSGNAEIEASGLVVRIEGKPNRFKRRGRPWSAFAAKSSRVARFLLQDPRRFYRQREISRQTGLSESFVSKTVHRLEEDALLVRDPGSRAIRPRDPALLLDAWKEHYDFFRHSVIRGHVSAPSGDALLKKLSTTVEKAKIPYAATGLAAAWLIAPLAIFRTVTFYVSEDPAELLEREIGFRETERGPNVWIAVPNDEGVFQGSTERSGIPCVTPVQVYLDLGSHPERAREAAERIRRESLNW